MKYLTLLSLLCAALSAQTVQIVVKFGTVEKSWDITLEPKTVLADLKCTATKMKPGNIATCTVALNQPADANAIVTVTLPAGFTGPATVTIPVGSASATFTVTRQDVSASDPRVFTVAFSARMDGCATQYFSSVVAACYVRSDRCGLRDDQIAWEPCAG